MKISLMTTRVIADLSSSPSSAVTCCRTRQGRKSSGFRLCCQVGHLDIPGRRTWISTDHVPHESPQPYHGLLQLLFQLDLLLYECLLRGGKICLLFILTCVLFQVLAIVFLLCSCAEQPRRPEGKSTGQKLRSRFFCLLKSGGRLWKSKVI